MADRATMEEAVFNSRFPGYVDSFLEHVDRTSAAGLEGDQQAEAIWIEARPSHRQLLAADIMVDAAEWRQMASDVMPCSAALTIFARYLSSAKSFSREVDTLKDRPLIEKYTGLAQRNEQRRIEAGAAADRFAFFNEPRCALDKAYWEKLNSLSIDEAVAIYFGKDPRHVNLATLSPLKPVRRSPFKQQYAEMVEYLKRELDDKDASKQIYKSRLAKVHLLAVIIGKTQVDTEDGVTTQSRHSLYKIVLTMALKHYALDLRASTVHNIVFNKKSMLEDIRKVGIVLSEKTLLKYLGEAVEFSKEKELFRKTF